MQSTLRLVVEAGKVLGNALDSGVAVSGIDGIGGSGGSGTILGGLGGKGRGSLGVTVNTNDDSLLGDCDAAAGAALLEDNVAGGGTDGEVLHGGDGDTRGESLAGVLKAGLDVGDLVRLGDIITSIGPVGTILKTDNSSAVHEAGANEAGINVGLPVTHGWI